jgi:hypothetical protein
MKNKAGGECAGRDKDAIYIGLKSVISDLWERWTALRPFRLELYRAWSASDSSSSRVASGLRASTTPKLAVTLMDPMSVYKTLCSMSARIVSQSCAACFSDVFGRQITNSSPP